MTPLPLITIVGGMFAIVLVVPFGLYALLTRAQRRITREIRTAATQCGWRYRRRRTTLASAVEFSRNARELPSGYPALDNAYQVWALPDQIQQSPLDATLVDRVLHWPASAVAPHSVLTWRDPFGLHVEARLAGPANWATVSYFVALAEDLCAGLPGPLVPTQSPKFLGRIINRVLTS